MQSSQKAGCNFVGSKSNFASLVTLVHPFIQGCVKNLKAFHHKYTLRETILLATRSYFKFTQCRSLVRWHLGFRYKANASVCECVHAWQASKINILLVIVTNLQVTQQLAEWWRLCPSKWPLNISYCGTCGITSWIIISLRFIIWSPEPHQIKLCLLSPRRAVCNTPDSVRTCHTHVTENQSEGHTLATKEGTGYYSCFFPCIPPYFL